MSDAADVLGVRKEKKEKDDLGNLFRHEPTRRIDIGAISKKGKKPTVSREVRALMGKSAPPLVPTQQIGLKDKQKRTIHWKWDRIESSARNTTGPTGRPANDVELRHWVKFDVPDYRFARFNKPIRFLQYSDAEYQQLLQHPDWTKQETDTLFDLCRRFDLRSIIIADQFNPVEEQTNEYKGQSVGQRIAKERSVEELKDRFYSIQMALIKARSPPGSDLSSNPLFANAYDMQAEINRREQLLRLLRRTNETERQLAELVFANRELDQQILKAKKHIAAEKKRASTKQAQARRAASQAHAVFAVPAPPTLPHASPTLSANSHAHGHAHVHTPHGHADMAGAIPVSGAVVAPSTPALKKRKSIGGTTTNGTSTPRGAEAPADGLGPAALSELAAAANIFKELPSGVYVRSQLVTSQVQITGRQAKHLEQELQSLGFGKTRPLPIATAAACEQFDKLRVDVMQLQVYKKLIQKKQTEKAELQPAGWPGALNLTPSIHGRGKGAGKGKGGANHNRKNSISNEDQTPPMLTPTTPNFAPTTPGTPGTMAMVAGTVSGSPLMSPGLGAAGTPSFTPMSGGAEPMEGLEMTGAVKQEPKPSTPVDESLLSQIKRRKL